MPSHSVRTLALLFLALCLLPAHARAQARGEAERPKVFCEPSRALALVGEQLSEAKAFDDTVKRIAVMTRAAEMLWPREQKQARAVFAEAFELASSHYRARGDEVRREQGRADSRVPGLVMQLPDQRFVVLHAIARRDTAWARELALRAAEETREEVKKNAEAAGGERMQSAAGKLLPFAESMLETDRQTALSVARSTFAEPATMYLPRFLYTVAAKDRATADALFREALASYASRDEVNSFIYLSYYPFALTQAIAQVSPNMGMRQPEGFGADAELQRLFVAAFLGFAERRLNALTEQPPPDEPRGGRYYEPETIYTALKVLEVLYGARQPGALERITALEGRAVTLLSAARQRGADAYTRRDLDGGSTAPSAGAFDRAMESAEKMPANRREQSYASAILWLSAPEPLEKVEAAAQKVEDPEVRRQVLSWLYFSRAQTAAKAGEFDEARKFAERVEALDERALLFLDIASEGLRRSDDKQRAEELLSAVVAAARKSPDTVAKARVLLGVADMYERFDYLRGLAVLGEAVGVVNKLKEPDLGLAPFIRRIQGKDFSTFMTHPVPGFTLEGTFGSLGGREFEATLAPANELGDKYLRATAVLALAARCLQEAEKQQKPQKPKKPAPAKGGGKQ